jgi:hypothetical protein
MWSLVAAPVRISSVLPAQQEPVGWTSITHRAGRQA